MDSPSTTAEGKHQYQQQWKQGIAKTATTRTGPLTPGTEFPPALYPQHLDLQSLYQAQLNLYNDLISPGRGGGGGSHSVSYSPTASPRTQQGPRSRSSSKSLKVANREQQGKVGTQSCHGNKAGKNIDPVERAVVTPAKEASKMPTKKNETGHTAPTRPAVKPALAPAMPPTSDPANNARPTPAMTSGVASAVAQSSSVPSTPHQHARKFSFESREPSPNATQNHSPRSAYSEANGNVPSLRPLPPRLVGGCRYETAIPHSRRRIPYNIGTERLDQVDPSLILDKLPEEIEKQLTTDMRELYDRLLPTPKVEKSRQQLVQKLEKLFNDEWPGHDIRVHLFGSSGNLLCTDDADVDICITTEWKELEGVCMIAELLAKHGMEKVICVKSAKVPIVKIWDPELGLACDMNVNNTSALENTRMMRTYVEIDPRVRPLAMIIKHWTRRRILNDAAFGGTLSSYTWICMIIAFLQLRDPPILPALHQRHKEKSIRTDGRKSEFADDVNKLKGYGEKNKSTLGELLYNFFKFYAYEFDYDKFVLSVRQGKLLLKTEKGWHFGVNNTLCIEEPFNTARNLGNTADDTSFRGLHMELRRASDALSEGRFEESCEEYVFPKEEEKVWQKPASAPRPVLVRSSSQQQSSRGGRGNYRGGGGGGNGGNGGNGGGGRGFRNNNNNSNSRRASSVVYDPIFNVPIPQVTWTQQELYWLQQNHAAQQMAIPQDMLAHAYQQMQNGGDMRFSVYAQSQQIAQQQALLHAYRMANGGPQPPQQATPTDRSRTNSFDLPAQPMPPLSADIVRHANLGYPTQSLASSWNPYSGSGYSPYPSSPVSSTGTAAGTNPEFRRGLHRSTLDAASSGNGAIRSQSQPASRTPMPTSAPQGIPTSVPPLQVPTIFAPQNGIPNLSFMPDEQTDAEGDETGDHIHDSPEDEGPRYVGYYVTDPSSPPRGAVPNNGLSFGDLGDNSRRRLSSDTPQSILDRRMRRTSRSPSPLGHARAFSAGTSSAPLASAPFSGKPSSPLVVNGSASKPAAQGTARARANVANEYNNPLHIGQGVTSGDGPHPAQAPPFVPAEATNPMRPLVVNGSSSMAGSITAPVSAPMVPDLASFQQRLLAGTPGHGSFLPSYTGLTLASRPRGNSRASQNGIAPLDLATSEFTAPTVHANMQNLSPVYENRTPSPRTVRKPDGPTPKAPTKMAAAPVSADDAKAQKPPAVKTSIGAKQENQDRSPTEVRMSGAPRENGHTRNSKSQEAAGSWIKQKGRKKAGDLRNTTNGMAQSEAPPKNEADRKGG